jgi:hypothetical protein
MRRTLAVPTEGSAGPTPPPTEAENRALILFDRGDGVTVRPVTGIRFLLVSGKPLKPRGGAARSW